VLQFLAQVEEGDIDGAIEQVSPLPFQFFRVVIRSSFTQFSTLLHLPPHPRNVFGHINGIVSVLPNCWFDSDGRMMRALLSKKP
jgi:hypothetical protein